MLVLLVLIPDSTFSLTDVGNWRAPAAKCRLGFFPCTQNKSRWVNDRRDESAAGDRQRNREQPLCRPRLFFSSLDLRSCWSTSSRQCKREDHPDLDHHHHHHPLHRALHQTPKMHHKHHRRKRRKRTTNLPKNPPPPSLLPMAGNNITVVTPNNNEGLCALQQPPRHPLPGLRQRTNDMITSVNEDLLRTELPQDDWQQDTPSDEGMCSP
ncbi:uncharacterized protein [Misgurnus anguillicaudatus]|uniref:uncharacterized protein isoform X1 n=1 Tax=Misgurnus anguillicaudatus TaxID=75329 RepID=UPI003CCF1E1F